MEAVPKLPMLSFELKVSPETTHFGPKLKQYISEAYREDPNSYSNDLHQLESLRSAAVRPTIDSSGLSALNRYFCQLRAIQSRFPMAKGQPAAVPFAWKDIFANMSCSLSDIRFEMACILYNIGAFHTKLAALEPRNTPDSLKSACTHLQKAGWAFQHLREQYPQPSGVDVSQEIMRFFQEICFAQAQECILEKSILDTKKPSVVGAVAMQVLVFYRNSLALLGPSTGQDTIYEIIGTKLYNHWYRYLSFKSSYIGCIVCLYQGMNAEEQQKMGERVAFYQQSVDKLTEARKLAKYIDPVEVTQEALTFTNDVVEGKRKAAKNENEFIYHEEVPDKDMLLDMKPVCLIKAVPINFNDPEVSGPDIFARLVPMGAHEASSLYSEEKAKMLRHVVTLAEEKNTELMEFMSSLQLDQLDVISSDQRIPQEIVDRCAAMNAKSDIIQTLVDSMNGLAEIITDVEHSLAEIKNMIQEETAKEKEYQKVMGPRPPSIVQTELSREYNKYQEAHTRTNESNQVLHKAMTLHITNLRLLALPLDELQNKIPSIDNIEGIDRASMAEMRRVVGKAREMQTQRDALIHQLREAVNSDDITSQLLARSSEPRNEIFKQEMEKHTPKVKIIEQNLAAQENIINKLTSIYASYGESRRLLADVIRKREGVINALITSYDTHEELLGKSQKGLEFYKRLTHNVSQLLTRLRGTCQVQEEERAQHLAKQNGRGSSTPTPTSNPGASKNVASDPPAPSTSISSTPKLRDYLPYMKTRGSRSITPAQPDNLASDSYYPETMYPTSVRPAPVGSEATADPVQMKYPDGYVMPSSQSPNPYSQYAQYGSVDNTYSASNQFYQNNGKSMNYEPPQVTKPAIENDNVGYGYNSSYQTAPYSANSQATNPQYSTFYSGPQEPANDTYSSGPYLNQPSSQSLYMYNDLYATPQASNSYTPIPETITSASPYFNQPDLSGQFSQMQLSKPEAKYETPNNAFSTDHSQNYYISPPQTSTPSVTYGQLSNLPSVPSDSIESSNQFRAIVADPIVSPGYIGQNIGGTSSYNTNPNSDYSYGNTSLYNSMNQTYPTYTLASSTAAAFSTATSLAPTVNQAAIDPVYNVYSNLTPEPDTSAITISDLDDKPIKSHVTGEALSNVSSYQMYQPYESNIATSITTTPTTYPNVQEPLRSPQNYVQDPQQTPQNYVQHPQSVPQSYVPEPQTVPQCYVPDPQSLPQGYVQEPLPTPQNSIDQTSNGYSQSFQNHPGYTFNVTSGSYDYNYGGSQNSYGSSLTTVHHSVTDAQKDQNWAQGVYTSAGHCQTVQSPSENQQVPQMEPSSNQAYYNSPYGYQTVQPGPDMATTVQQDTTNFANNQYTYMQSGHVQESTVTYSSNNNNQVSTTKEYIEPTNYNINETQNYEQTPVEQPKTENQENATQNTQQVPVVSKEPEVPVKVEPTTFDLLSEIDFSVEQKPLMPEIKVPQVSESTIKKFIPPKLDAVKPVPKAEDVIERPAKVDLFSDPSLLNKFTQEVKNLQKLVDSLTNKAAGGVTVLDAKWKFFQDLQAKENMCRSKTIAMQYSDGNIVSDVVPYDDTRLILKYNPDAYINASYYKQLAPWCIPILISKAPSEEVYVTFWRAVLENRVSCIVCLLSEIEMQGYSYFPTAKGQTLELDNIRVTLEDVTCTVHWTERRLSVAEGKTVLNLVHYQISVFPAKIVCSPLVLLADKILSVTYENKRSNQLNCVWIHCAQGAGRSSVVSLLLMVMCQVRAGQLDLCDMLDAACVNLYKHRANVLEDTKYLADAYRTALFYVQGVLCSGTTLFNGETVATPSGASVLPPVTPTSQAPIKEKDTKSHNKFSRESFEEMKQSPGLKGGDMKDPLNFLDPLWSLKKK